MELKKIFNAWAHQVKPEYARKQWLLSKWEMCEGIDWPPDKQEIMLKSIQRSLQLNSVDVLIDLGCGGGWISNALRPYVSQLKGLDISLEMLKHFQTVNIPSECVCGEIAAIPFKSNSFDKLLCYYVFINFSDDRYIERSLIEIVRILKKGGRALIGQLPDKNGSGQYDQAKKEYMQYNRNRLDPGIDTSDIFPPPLKLFDKEQLIHFLKKQNVHFYFAK